MNASCATRWRRLQSVKEHEECIIDHSEISRKAHALPHREVLVILASHEQGLSQTEIEQRQEQYGTNSLSTGRVIRPLHILLNQFRDTIIYILLAAVIFSLLIGEVIDSIIIVAILIANSLIGFFQELSAQRSLESLQRMAAARAEVRRSGKTQTVDAEDLVPGDILLLTAGDKVAADARILSAVRLKVAEDILTGESEPVSKDPATIEETAAIGDRSNMVFSSTSVVSGRGIAVVTATGMQTEIGKITAIIKETEKEMTPLQRRLHVFGKKLGLAVLLICTLVFALFVGREMTVNHLTLASLSGFFFIAVSLAVAAVPTALPAVVTIALSIGVKRLLKKNALVRNLASVETLGSCDVICTDKTGTLTRNEMTVRFTWTIDGEARLTGRGYIPEGTISKALAPILYSIGLTCNNSNIAEQDGKWIRTGDPTEAALIVSATKVGVVRSLHHLDELPFDSIRKMMSVQVRDDAGKEYIYTKGAPNNVLAACTHILHNEHIVALTPALCDTINAQNEQYAKQALRVLAFAYRPLKEGEELQEHHLVFVGLQAMKDPPRIDVADSIATAKGAGIRIIMATGDYAATAQAIGREIGIHGSVCSGSDLDAMDDTTLTQTLQKGTNIFARVIPEHKQRIISCLQQDGHTVAMTGDGVNDAPALKKADIGVAVGSGTEVARETADFVLLDDSFSHLVNAIQEGRGIYENIQKSIMLLLSGNLGEVLIILGAALLGMNLPLTAILLLWINLITDGAPALAFSVDPYGADIMQRLPKPKNEKILPKEKLRLLVVLGCVGTTIALTLFALYGGRSATGTQLILAQTMVFNFVVLYECILVFIIRATYHVPLRTNPWIWASVIFTIGLQVAIMYTPARNIFDVAALKPLDLTLLTIAGVVFYCISLLYHLLDGNKPIPRVP